MNHLLCSSCKGRVALELAQNLWMDCPACGKRSQVTPCEVEETAENPFADMPGGVEGFLHRNIGRTVCGFSPFVSVRGRFMLQGGRGNGTRDYYVSITSGNASLVINMLWVTHARDFAEMPDSPARLEFRWPGTPQNY